MSVGYDHSCTILSQEGKIYQIEYAEKAIDNAPTTLGLVCSDGVIFVSEKIRLTKTLIVGSNPTIFTVTKNIGIMIGGLLPDGRNLFSRAKTEAGAYLNNWGVEITGKILAERLAAYVHLHTLYFGMRPFGAICMISSIEKDNSPHLYMVEATGNCIEYIAASQGKGKQFVKTEVEKNNYGIRNSTCSQSIYEAMKIVMRSYEGEKETEYDVSYISRESNGEHKLVERSELNKLMEKAKVQIEEDRKIEID